MIEVRSLTKRMGPRTIVDSVDFEAANGRVTGLLGPNGAGKTTTLRMISGLVKPDRGAALVDGIEVGEDPLAARKRLGILPDEPGCYPRLTVREHLDYSARLHGMGRAVASRAIDRAVELAGLESAVERRTAGFSRGERQRLALAGGLIHDPGNVILDEPTNGLDVAASRALRAAIRRMAESGRSVVFSSHVMQDVAALCDDIVVLDAGKVVARGTPPELLERTGQATLEEAFLSIIGHGEGLT